MLTRSTMRKVWAVMALAAACCPAGRAEASGYLLYDQSAEAMGRASAVSAGTREPAAIWAEYFERLTQAAASGLFDFIGHADLPKKFGCYPPPGCEALFPPFLEAARKADVAIELNTAGLRKDCREIYPSRSFLELARARGVPIVFGSDAHAPAEVGLNFAEALALALEVGYTHACRFERRRRQTIALPSTR